MNCPLCQAKCFRDKEDIKGHIRYKHWYCSNCEWVEDLIPPELQEGMDQVFRVDDNNRYILMAEEIMNMRGKPRPSMKHRIYHIDGDYLNNQDKNITWIIPDKSRN